MIIPIRNQILVEPIMTESVSEGGIIVPESFRGRECKAKVLAVGKGSKDRPMTIPNNVILWHIKGAGHELIDDGKQYFLIDQGDVLGYLEN